MATWNGNAILARHKCGAKYWFDSGEFFAFAVIGREWWKGDRVIVCACGYSWNTDTYTLTVKGRGRDDTNKQQQDSRAGHVHEVQRLHHSR